MYLEINEREISGNKLLRIVSYDGYDFRNNAGQVKYEICNYVEVVGYDSDGKWILKTTPTNDYFIAKVLEQTGDIELDVTIVNQWGASDQLIFDYVASQLGITLI